jgi:hypothetical protein
VYAVKDIPPVSSGGFVNISEPRIYYGESTSGFAIVKGNSSEFDYPQGDANKQYQYTGNGGIRLSLLNRLAFSFVNQDVNILISGQISSESRIMVYRNLQERIKHIAPFLEVDSDPYIVADPEGKLFWFGQGYTTSQYFPYSEYYNSSTELNGKAVNYIRNSFMYTVNAFDGTTTFYLIDKADPIAATIDRVYPGLSLVRQGPLSVSIRAGRPAEYCILEVPHDGPPCILWTGRPVGGGKGTLSGDRYRYRALLHLFQAAGVDEACVLTGHTIYTGRQGQPCGAHGNQF